ncbi:unnamed protein product [Rotaria sp. Silwood1]|nr:unnamed protein product [Rotaria sp. Silwood1]
MTSVYLAFDFLYLLMHIIQNETWWSSILTPSSSITHLSISGQLQSYCGLIRRHELYVEYLTSLITHPQLLLFFYLNKMIDVHNVYNLFGLIYRTSVASHLFVESIFEGIDLDESGLLLVFIN